MYDFDSEDFDASSPDPKVDGNLVIIVNDAISERVCCADFTTTVLFDRVGGEFRFTQSIGGATIDLFTAPTATVTCTSTTVTALTCTAIRLAMVFVCCNVFVNECLEFMVVWSEYVVFVDVWDNWHCLCNAYNYD